MKLLFFNFAGNILFERDDAESASVVHEEMTLSALFPYDDKKIIHRGMRVGYQEQTGTWQAFEIRKVKTHEPDHYQEISAENIAISELTDEFYEDYEWNNAQAGTVLTQVLYGTGWSVGTTAVNPTSSAKTSNTNVWQVVQTISKNWNVYIVPRVTVGASGITGKYLDILSTDGTWRGLRLSLEKNMDECGVTWDDSRVKTALYAFGKETGNGEDAHPITFADVVWQQTADHPAKPAGQKCLIDPDATAEYGRNGRARYAFYQNSDIDNPQVLLEKTWESLKTLNHPDVTIDCTVSDLYRLGYKDVPLRLYDIAQIEIRPTGTKLHKQIIQYTEDLINPLESRLVIGTYIPNIIYISKETKRAAGGGGGGGGGMTDSEFDEGNTTFRIIQEEDRVNMIIQNVGDDGTITAASIALAINTSTGESIALIQADHVEIQGNTVFTDNVDVQNALSALRGDFDNLITGQLTATLIYTHNLQATISGSGSSATGGYISGSTIYAADQLSVGASGTGGSGIGSFYFQGKQVSWMSTSYIKTAEVTTTRVVLGSSHNFIYETSSGTQATVSGRLVDSYERGTVNIVPDTLYYLGRSAT